MPTLDLTVGVGLPRPLSLYFTFLQALIHLLDVSYSTVMSPGYLLCSAGVCLGD